MKTVAIANQKGGCGKTTTAINLSAALGARGKRVLLIDLDPQAHATFGLRAKNPATDKSVYYVLTDNPAKKRPLDSCIASVSPNFDIVPSNIQLSTLEQELKDREDAVSGLYRTLAACPSTYEYVIIDCPPSLGFLTFNALRAVDQVIVPTDMSAFTLMGVGKLLGMIELIQMKFGHAPRVKALATLFDKRTRYSQSMRDEIRGFFGDQMLQTVIRLNVTLKRAASEGVSVIDFDETSNGAQDYIALADELLGLAEAAETRKPVPSSLPVLEPREMILPAREGAENSLAPDMKEVTFTVEAKAAKEIYIVGDFNDWKITEESRFTQQENGSWEKRIGLRQGRYRYKFFVDGAWVVDSQNPELEPNVFGTFDSIMNI